MLCLLLVVEIVRFLHILCSFSGTIRRYVDRACVTVREGMHFYRAKQTQGFNHSMEGEGEVRVRVMVGVRE